MAQGSKERTFAVQNRQYTVRRVQAKLTAAEKGPGRLVIELKANGEPIEIEAPWHANVDKGERVTAVYSAPTGQEEDKLLHYLFNNDQQTMEEKRKFPKPNKGIGLAVLDFVLLIALGVTITPFIIDLAAKSTAWGIIGLFAVIIVLYLLIQKATYTLVFKKELERVAAINRYIEELMEQ
jgi:hypothetical protein